MDTSAAGEGSSFTFRVKQEPGQCEAAGPPVAIGDDAGRTIRKVTVLDPLKLKLLSRQNHNMLLSGLNAGNFPSPINRGTWFCWKSNSLSLVDCVDSAALVD